MIVHDTYNQFKVSGIAELKSENKIIQVSQANIDGLKGQ